MATGGRNFQIQNLNFNSNRKWEIDDRRPLSRHETGWNTEGKHLNQFIWAHNHLVDTDILERLNIGDEKATAIALEQIHYRSLEGHRNLGGKQQHRNPEPSMTYREALNRHGNPGFSNTMNLNSGWTQVNHRKKTRSSPSGAVNRGTSIFLYGIPDDATGKDIWNLFKGCGVILDIILPKKRDKKGMRFGFVKTTDEREAGAIINNAKMEKGLGRKIKMSINLVSNQTASTGLGENKHKAFSAPPRKPDGFSNNPLKMPQENHAEIPKVTKTPVEGNKFKKEVEADFSKKMFEFTEVEVDVEVEKALLESKIGYTWFEEDVKTMQDRFNDMNLGYLKVISLSKRKFLISKNKEASWDDLNNTDLSVWFSHIRDYVEEDHILSRVVWLESVADLEYLSRKGQITL